MVRSSDFDAVYFRFNRIIMKRKEKLTWHLTVNTETNLYCSCSTNLQSVSLSPF